MRRVLLALLLAWGIGGTGFAQTAPLLQLQGQPFSGGSATLHLSGDVGQPAFVLYGLNPLDPPLQLPKGAYFLGWLANIVPLGTIPASGRIDVPFTVPPLHSSLAGIPMVMQGFVPGALSNPATLPLDQPHYVPGEATVLVSPIPTVVGAFGDRVATGDFNDDGLMDVAVGAWFEDIGGVDRTGRAYVFWGPDMADVAILEPPSPKYWGLFGQGIAVADFDGDGVDDVVISEGNGSPPPPNAPGTLFLYRGGPAFSSSSTMSVASAGVGAPYHIFGHQSVVADFNGDGSPDLANGAAVSTENGFLNAGRVEIYLGPGLDEVVTIIAPDVDEFGFFGDRLADGDVNGDGIKDVIIGCPRKKIGPTFSMGRVYIFTGPSLVHSKTIDHPDPDGINSRFGNAVVGQDMNGDGLADVIATDQRNHAYIFWAPDFDTFERIIRPPDPVSGTAISISFGYFATAGDVNSDGWKDIVIGEPFAAGKGRVYVALGPYYASFHVLSDKIPEAGAEFGWGVLLEDVDSDGRFELLVGSDLADPGGVSGAGRVTMFDLDR